MFVGFPFSRAPMVGIPIMVDSCSCDHFPWLTALISLSFIAIDDVVVKEKVFLRPVGAKYNLAYHER